MRSYFTLFALSAATIFAQSERISYGVSGSGVFSRLSGFGPSDKAHHLTVGPSVQLHLNPNVSLDVSFLYRRTGGTYSYGLVPDPNQTTGTRLVNTIGQIRGNSWSMPVIGKYTFRAGEARWRPFLGAGFAFQTAWQTQDNTFTFQDLPGTATRNVVNQFSERTRIDVGAVFSSGLVFRKGHFSYIPEVRYTRWGEPNLSHSRNQGEALFSVRFSR